MSTREKAIVLAKIGFEVFPLKTNEKIPAIAVVTGAATSDVIKVKETWTDVFGQSRDLNIGISTDNLVVIDFDIKHGYPAMNADFERLIKAYPTKYVVRTPSGGLHAYYRLSPSIRCANTAKKLGKTVDTRSFHGYVLGVGSSINGETYSWLESDPDGFERPNSVDDLPIAPDGLIQECGAPAERMERQSDIELDTPAALSQAKEYLIKQAPVARQGRGGDHATYSVACRVRDFGVSQNTAIDLMSEHWNETKAVPPWSLDELEHKVENAYRYAKGVPHVPGSEFDTVEIDVPEPSPVVPADCPRFVEQPFFDAAAIPRRQWIVEDVLARGFLTLVNAPPGAGKTQWLAQLLLAVTFDRSDMVDYVVREPVNVWSFNAEDDLNELKRRIGGAVIGYGLRKEDQITKYSISSGVSLDFKVATWDAAKQRVVKNQTALKAFAKQIVANNVGVVILDPFADIHEVPESNNDAIKMVARIFTELAIESNAAIVIATHSRKQPGASSEGHAGNAESVRGGFSQVAKARIMLTITGASIKDAKAAKIDLDDRGSFIRIDTAKNNLGTASRGAKPKWFKFEGVPLGNGDSVGVLRKVELAESRVKEEKAAARQLGFAEVVAQILVESGVAAGDKLRWPNIEKEVARRLGLSEAQLEKEFAKQPDQELITAGSGRQIKIKKMKGRGGSYVTLLLDKQLSSEFEEIEADDTR